jgi:hypothetical protein
MAFYLAGWSPVCTDQMALYNEILPPFHDYDAVIVGISVDSAWCHAALTNLFGCARGLILRERDERGQHHAAEPARGISERDAVSAL